MRSPFFVPLGERLSGPESCPMALTPRRWLGRGLLLSEARSRLRSCLAGTRSAFSSQSRATRAPKSVPRFFSGWAASFPLPVLRSRALTPPLTLHEFHASRCSSAPVPESAPATVRACALLSLHSPAV